MHINVNLGYNNTYIVCCDHTRRWYPSPWRQQRRWWPPVRPPSASSCQLHICLRSSPTWPIFLRVPCLPPPTAPETWDTPCCRPRMSHRSVHHRMHTECMFWEVFHVLCVLTDSPACVRHFNQQLHLLDNHANTDTSQAFSQWVRCKYCYCYITIHFTKCLSYQARCFSYCSLPTSEATSRPRKPCNCTRSQCLKLYVTQHSSLHSFIFITVLGFLV